MVDESFDTEFANEEPKNHEFRAKPTYQKLFVITAGVMMNLTLAVAIFWGINFFQGKQVMKTTTIGELAPGGKAEMIGFQSNDKIISINGKEVDNWDAVLNGIFIDNVSENKLITVERNNNLVEVTIPSEKIKSATEEVPFLQPGDTKPIITDVMKNSPADDAGIKPYDLFLFLNNIPLNTSAKAIDIISSNPDTEMPLVILRDTDTVSTKVKPAMDGKIGVTISDSYAGPIDFQTYGFFESVTLSFGQAYTITYLTISSLGSVIKGDIEFKNAFGGPVKIAKYAAQSADNGIISFLFFLAMLSLSLAIINILPFPVLDGGHFVIILIEGLLKKELPIKIKIGIQNAGFVVLLLLMAFIIYNDIISL